MVILLADQLRDVAGVSTKLTAQMAEDSLEPVEYERPNAGHKSAERLDPSKGSSDLASRPELGKLKIPSKAAQIGESEDTSAEETGLNEASTLDKQAQQEGDQRSASAIDMAAKSPGGTGRNLEEFKTNSLPPEILGLFNKRDTRNDRLGSRQISSQAMSPSPSNPNDIWSPKHSDVCLN